LVEHLKQVCLEPRSFAGMILLASFGAWRL